MSLKHILLGILQEPHSGYDIKKVFDQVFSNFWAAELSQIYPQLKKLSEQNMLSVVEEESDKGPSKKVYQTTEKGQKELVNWLQDGPIVHTEKLAYLAQTFFLNSLATTEQKLEFMQALQHEMKTWHQNLCGYQKDWQSRFPNYPYDLPDDEFYPNLTLMMGVKKVGAIVEWCEESIDLIKLRL
ncbi:MAG: helix-turn-helix transcriptional regulator [Kangiellaceae bacterium]|nr:helix-turn-helix transcriptional regulator [Kangiellaceae bacterium]